MSIITKCPSCGTTFRVTPPQLQAQHGMVRCGRCANVFDGFKTLATLSDVTPLGVAPQAVARDDSPATAVTRSPVEEARVVPAIDTPPAEPPRQELAPVALPDDAAAGEPMPLAQTVVAESAPLPIAPADFSKPAQRRRAGGWAFGALILFAGLAAQGAYFYRVELAANVPELRPHLSKMCELLHCTVALPQQPCLISIVASELQATDPAKPGLITLTATLRNNARVELGYPTLDVVLTNTQDHPIARRIFLATEYLDAGKRSQVGIAPNAEVTVRLNLDTGDLGAVGFRLDRYAVPAC